MTCCFLPMICRRPSMQDLLSHCLNSIHRRRLAVKIVRLVPVCIRNFNLLNTLWNVMQCFVLIVVIFSLAWVILIQCLQVLDFVIGRDAIQHWRNIPLVNLTYRPQRTTAVAIGSVASQVQGHASKLTERNRSVLSTLSRIGIFCGRQGLPLRGHRESHEDPSSNDGNFLSLVELIALESCGFHEKLESLPKNATYISKDSQNEILHASVEVILDTICTEKRVQHVFPWLPMKLATSAEANRCRSVFDIFWATRYANVFCSIC